MNVSGIAAGTAASSSESVADEFSAVLRQQLKATHLVPLWESPSGHHSGAGPAERPHLWRWESVRPTLMEVAKSSSPKVVERRVMVMVNPASAAVGNDATTGLVAGNYQTLLPGERARPHRHAMNALRFILEGAGAVSVIDGKHCAMEAGDLVLTPAWTWHEHVHQGNAPFIWVDVLDVILHRFIGTAAFEPGPVYDVAPQYDDGAFASANMLPLVEFAGRAYSPVFRYPWAQAVASLANAPTAADGSRTVRYVNPLTGGSCLPLLDCRVVQLAPDQITTGFRTNASTLCTVVEGDGTTLFDAAEQRLEWQSKDCFTVPANHWASYQAGSKGARLFTVSDREVFARLGLLSEQARVANT